MTLGVVAGLVGSVVLASLAGARRTATAGARLLNQSEYWDVVIRIYDPDGGYAVLDRISSLPQVDGSARFSLPIGRADGTLDWFYPQAAQSVPIGRSYRPVLVSGRPARADRADEVVVSTVTARRYPLGSTISWTPYTAEQLRVIDEQPNLRPGGTHQILRVVGVMRDPADADLSDVKVVYGTQAMASLVGADIGGVAAGISLRDGDRDQAEFEAIVRNELAAQGIPEAELEVVTTAPRRAAFEDTLRPLVVGLALFAVVVLVFGMVALGLVAARMLATNQRDQPVLRSLGLTPRDRALALAAPSVCSAAVAATVAVSVAAMLSPLFPIGAARNLEPQPGSEFDGWLLASGWILVAALVSVTFVVAALWRVRRDRRDSRTRRLSGRAVLSPASRIPIPAGIGVGFALNRGPSRSAVPVRLSIATVAFGVAGVVSVTAFALTVSRLTTTPARFGVPWDLSLESDQGDIRTLARDLAGESEVAAVALEYQAYVRIDELAVGAFSYEPVRGALPSTVLDGREPSGPGEALVGPVLLDRLGRRIGETISLGPAESEDKGRMASVRIVGTALTPTTQDDQYSAAVQLTAEGFHRLFEDKASELVVVDLQRGVDVKAALRRLDQAHPESVQDESLPTRPAPVDNLAQFGRLPLILAGLLGLIALLALTYVLASALLHRRHDLAVLRSLGLTSRQTGTTMAWMSGTTTGVAIITGVPLGIAFSALTWRWVATRLALDSGIVKPPILIAGFAAASILVALAVSTVPARTAAHYRPAAELRTE